jgi:hypothetical protein
MTPALDLNLASTSTLATTAIEEDKMDIEWITSLGSAPDIACDLGAGGAAAQAQRWLRLGREAGLGRSESADGLQIRFRDEAAVERELHELVSVEGRCCAWARWEVYRANRELVLQVSSTPEGAAALHAMFSPGGVEGERASSAPLG